MVPRARSLEDPFSVVRGGCASVAAVALGSQPFLSLHQRPVARSLQGSGRSLIATAFAIGSYARSWVLRKPNESEDPGGPAKIAGFAQTNELQVTSQPAAALELPVVAKFIDSTRQGELLVPAPLGDMALAATCDTFGRVALFCLETLRCLHLWKGYRDAQVAWLGCGCLGHNFQGRRWSFMPRAGACWSYGICVLALRPSALELVAWALTAYSSHKPGKRIWFGRMESLIELFGHLEPRCPLQAVLTTATRSIPQTAIRANQKSRQTHFGGRKNWVTSG
ncbi:unnamed protein product [Durusdinium trenchii]|uniref:Uncharacterized protein n=2 Tax=Durusdinium trenchii TaxID=1381693 RepID=A0ABP0MLJ4_9DINO